MIRKNLLFALLFFTVTVGKAQTDIFRSLFDTIKSFALELYLTPEGNDYSAYGDGLSYGMEGLLRMYENTHESEYLHDFICASSEVIQNRDDHRGVMRKLPVWSTNHRTKCYGPMTHQTALILIPMVHYCYLVKQSHYEEVEKLPFGESWYTFDSVSITHFTDYADWLEEKVMKTVRYYDQYYWNKDSCMIQYADDHCTQRYVIEGTDRQMNWGYVFLYLAMINPGTEQSAFYLDKYESIICRFKSRLSEQNGRSQTSYYLWPELGWTQSQNGKVEDISHGAASIDLIQFSYDHRQFIQENSKNRCTTTTYFSKQEALKFANTFSYSIYHSPLHYHNAIDGSCYFWKYPKDCSEKDFTLEYGLARWLGLSKIEIHNSLSDAQLFYSRIADYYTSYLFRPRKMFHGTVGTNMLGLATASTYKHHFSPLGATSLDSLSIPIFSNRVLSGVLNHNKRGQFSVLFQDETGQYNEYRFELTPTRASVPHRIRRIRFDGIGYSLKNIPLSAQEKQKVTEIVRNNKPNHGNRIFEGRFVGTKNKQQLRIQGRKLTLTDSISSQKVNSYSQALPRGSYLFCVGNFDKSSQDQLIIYNKNNGLLEIFKWDPAEEQFIAVTNYTFPQDQFIEYITTVSFNGKSILLLYRSADRIISLFEVQL